MAAHDCAMDFQCVPNEICVRIFSFLDGISLMRSRRTCRRWNEIICHGDSQMWKNICYRELESDIVSELPAQRDVNCDHQMWRNTFIEYHRSRHLANFNASTTKIPIHKHVRGITCVKVSGDCLITGDACGDVWIWDAVNAEKILRLCKHTMAVNDIVLVDLFHLGKFKFERYETAHHHVITCGDDSTIKMTKLQMSEDRRGAIQPQSLQMTKCFVCLRLFGKILLARNHDACMYAWELSAPEPSSSHIQSKLVHVFQSNFPAQSFYMGIWKDVVTIITLDADTYKFDASEKSWTCRQDSSLEPVTGEGSADLDYVIIQYCFLFHEKTIIFVTIQGNLGVSVDGRRYVTYSARSTLDSLKGRVTCAKVYCNYLVLGTEKGGVYVYYYAKKKDLLNLNLHKPLWSTVTTSSAVDSLDMWLDTKRVAMAVVKDDSMDIVLWNHEDRP